MNDAIERSLIKIDPDNVDIGVAAQLRFRHRLPGEEGESESDARLTASVGRCGVIQPPLLMGHPARSGEAPLVIQGHRRIAAARTAVLAGVKAVLIPEGGISKREAVVLWLEEIPAGETLSELEKIILTRKAAVFAGGVIEGLLSDLSRAFGRNLSIAYLERLWKLLGLEPGVLEALHAGRVSMGGLLQLVEHAAVDTAEAVRLLSSARLNRREQKEAVRMMLYLGDQGRESWKRFSGVVRPGGNPLEALRSACYPSLARDQRSIDEIVRGIHLPPGCTMQPPENMEGGSYKLHIDVRSERVLDEAIRKLRDAIKEGKIARLLGILKGENQGGTRG